MQEIPLSNCPALGFWDTFLYLNRAIMVLFLKLKWKPRHWWLAPSYQLPECREFAGKTFKMYSLNSWGISYTDSGCPDSISEPAAKKFWIKSSGMSWFSSNPNFFSSLPQIYTHDPPKPIMTQAKNQKQRMFCESRVLKDSFCFLPLRSLWYLVFSNKDYS